MHHSLTRSSNPSESGHCLSSKHGRMAHPLGLKGAGFDLFLVASLWAPSDRRDLFHFVQPPQLEG
jgi:hypothetical protein